MKLYEFEGKTIFREMNIPVPRGRVATTPEEAKAVAAELGYPVVVKAQVLSGGRGKAGAVKFAEGEKDLADAARALLGMEIAGEKVERILIEEKLNISREFYMGITLEPMSSLPVLMLSAQGGMDIEVIASNFPHQLFKRQIDPLQKPKTYQMLDVLLKTGLKGKVLTQAANIMRSLAECYFKNDCLTVEINPLVIDGEGRVMAADSKMEIDDSALYRVKSVAGFQRKEVELSPLEAEAKAEGVSYVALGEGDIGLISGGAGLGMASVDTISALGGKPANFLDLGGEATADKTAAALKIVLKTPGVRGVFLNVFGGINNCEQMAKGIARVLEEVSPPQAIVVKMRGHSQEEGWAILEQRKIPLVKHGTTGEAVSLLIQEMNRQKTNKEGVF